MSKGSRSGLLRLSAIALAAVCWVAWGVTGCSGGQDNTSGTDAGTDAGQCQSGQTSCNGVCVNTKSDASNCGTCGHACTADQVCDGTGKCAVECHQGFVNCGGTCVDPNTDEGYCGASGDCTGSNAGTVCAPGEVCNGTGECSVTCKQGYINCDTDCVDPNTNQAHCGASGDCTGSNAGQACAAGQICNGSGLCMLSCQQGLLDCGGTCTDPNTSQTYCGASGDCTGDNAGVTCPAGEICDGTGQCMLSCQQGLINCDSTCIDPKTDQTYCGASGDCTGNHAGTQCLAGQVCDGTGHCTLSCQQGLINCDGTCIDPMTDLVHCGAVDDCLGDNEGTQCLAGEVCDGTGHCTLSCQQNLINCGGTCTNPLTDDTHCGASGDCTGTNAGTKCASGQVCDGTGHCTLSCQQNLINCGGTCTNPLTDDTHCGASGDCTGTNAGTKCASGQVCDGTGHCMLSCQQNLINCGGTCTNPLTDDTHCGASGDCTGTNAGTKCASGQVCDGTGHCTLSCQQNLINCGGTCTNPLTDDTHCGASGDCTGTNAGTKCASGQVCDGTGHCTLSCQQNLINCGGTCTNPLTDNAHCGASGDCTGNNAGTHCDSGQVCDGTGHCVISCPVGENACGQQCFDLQITPQHCGDCDTACAIGQICSSGHCCAWNQQYCNGACIDVYSNNQDCGSCGHVCDSYLYCGQGQCICQQGAPQWQPCNGQCVYEYGDASNCGGCGTTCQATTPNCWDYACHECNQGYETCTATCDTYIWGDQNNCGSCHHKCTAQGSMCQQGTCACMMPGGVVCGSPPNDVCTDTWNDKNNCGGCGIQCTVSGQTCQGSCMCPQATPNVCNNTCVDQNNDPNNCGVNCTVCGATDSCSNGQCVPCSDKGQNWAVCDGQCMDTQSNDQYCGTTCTACDTGNGWHCSNGTCVMQLPGDTCLNPIVENAPSGTFSDNLCSYNDDGPAQTMCGPEMGKELYLEIMPGGQMLSVSFDGQPGMMAEVDMMMGSACQLAPGQPVCLSPGMNDQTNPGPMMPYRVVIFSTQGTCGPFSFSWQWQ